MSQKKRKKRYPSNLSEGAWRCLKPLLPVSAVGRRRQVSLRQVVNAILYALKTGCQWRLLPREFPAWAAVYYYFHRWSEGSAGRSSLKPVPTGFSSRQGTTLPFGRPAPSPLNSKSALLVRR